MKNEKLYQNIANILKQEIISGKYQVDSKLPTEREIAETYEISRTVVREALIMLEVEGFIKVKKGSGIYVKNQAASYQATHKSICGPFELLQARQLIETNIVEFATKQANKEDLITLSQIHQQSQLSDKQRDSDIDFQFHLHIAKITKNNALILTVETLWQQRLNNDYWHKLHSHIEDNAMESWFIDHSNILNAMIQKNPLQAKKAMWEHLEHTKQMLFNASSYDFNSDIEYNLDKYNFIEAPFKLE